MIFRIFVTLYMDVFIYYIYIHALFQFVDVFSNSWMFFPIRCDFARFQPVNIIILFFLCVCVGPST